MKTELITVIEKTIDVLVNNKVKYNWYDFEMCNCGILAQNACGISAATLRELSIDGTWTDTVRKCPQTGIPMSQILNKLYSLGLTPKDLVDLEHISNVEIATRAGFNPNCMNSTSPNNGVGFFETSIEYKSMLIKYLKAWRELLIEESQPKVEYKLVYSDQKVKDLTKEELIIN